MAIDHVIPELDLKGFRQFGVTMGIAIVVLFGLFFPWVLDLSWPIWPWIVAAVFLELAVGQPFWLRPIYRTWMRFGLLLSRVTTPLVLGIVFFAMISPMAFVRRLLGKDSLQRTLDPSQKSYRVQSKKSPKEKLEKPF